MKLISTKKTKIEYEDSKIKTERTDCTIEVAFADLIKLYELYKGLNLGRDTKVLQDLEKILTKARDGV